MNASQLGIAVASGSSAALSVELPDWLRLWYVRLSSTHENGTGTERPVRSQSHFHGGRLCRISKSESRNPKQVQNPELQIPHAVAVADSPVGGDCLCQAREQAATFPAAHSSDWGDVQASLGGDNEAYGRLVQRHQQNIGAYMWRFTRDRGQWEELVHDVFVEAFFSLSGYKGRAPLLHWLKKIATRVGYRYWKQRGRLRREVPLDDETLDAAACGDNAESAEQAAELVHQLLARLSHRDRLVLTLMYLEENSVAEIAELTGWSESLVKVQAHRARQRLKRICDSMGIEL
jgi:RNA polymerase sigma-70 factor (ECF subfamily)